MNYCIIPVTMFFQNCLLIWCEKTRLAVLVDPGGSVESIKNKIIHTNVILTQILLTHGHFDHVFAASELAQYYKVPIIGPEKKDKFLLQNLPIQSRLYGFSECQPLTPDRWLSKGDVISFSDIKLRVFHCPGHTPGHIAFFEKRSCMLISGDVIFKGNIGRSDFIYSNYDELINSIKKILLPLGDHVIFIPGHGPISTLGYERLYNSFLKEK